MTRHDSFRFISGSDREDLFELLAENNKKRAIFKKNMPYLPNGRLGQHLNFLNLTERFKWYVRLFRSVRLENCPLVHIVSMQFYQFHFMTSDNNFIYIVALRAPIYLETRDEVNEWHDVQEEYYLETGTYPQNNCLFMLTTDGKLYLTMINVTLERLRRHINQRHKYKLDRYQTIQFNPYTTHIDEFFELDDSMKVWDIREDHAFIVDSPRPAKAAGPVKAKKTGKKPKKSKKKSKKVEKKPEKNQWDLLSADEAKEFTMGMKVTTASQKFIKFC